MNMMKHGCGSGLIVGTILMGLTGVSAVAEPFTFVVMGDVPYRVPQQNAAFGSLIHRINAIRPAFTVHVGDIKNGSSRCDDELYASMRKAFDTFDQPLVYTPGDNEWTDCHRPDNGSYDPLERLARLRGVFFERPGSLGRRAMQLEHQSDDPKYASFVENTRWERDGIILAAVHIVGSNNNLQRDRTAVNEYIERNAANLAWIAAAFRRAEERNAKAVVLLFQADPNWDAEGREDQRSGFTDTIRALKTHAIRFAKPVLVVHGDKHRFVVDKPLYQNRRVIYNVTRLMVSGDNEVAAVSITVDPKDPDVFGFRTISVP